MSYINRKHELYREETQVCGISRLFPRFFFCIVGALQRN